MMTKLIVWAADIGSIQKHNFGWCRKDLDSVETGRDIDRLVDGICQDLSIGNRVALGFECPLFVPISTESQALTKARPGERSHPWSAGAGCGALATGLTEYTWIFLKIQIHCKVEIHPTFDFTELEEEKANLFIWEALVTGSGKGESHEADAKIAADTFWHMYPNICIEADTPAAAPNPFSLVGAGLLRAKLSSDIELLFKPCVVITGQTA
jgi:hypothetical protein